MYDAKKFGESIKKMLIEGNLCLANLYLMKLMDLKDESYRS